MADDPNIDPEKAEPTKNHPPTKNPVPPPTFSTILEIPETIIDKYNTDEKKRYRHERNRFRIEILTLVVIAIYTGIAGYQGCKMREATEAAKTSADAARSAASIAKETLDEMKKSGEITTNQADRIIKHLSNLAGSFRESTKQAKTALDTSIEGLRLDQRAWIGIPTVVVDSPEETHDSFSYKGLSLIFRNSGKTPALNSYISYIFIISRGNPPPFDYDKAVKDAKHRHDENFMLQPKRAQGVFTPGGVYPINISPPVKIQGQDAPIIAYILGTITYHDIFPGTNERTTKFCFIHGLGVSYDIFTPCPEGNWMD